MNKLKLSQLPQGIKPFGGANNFILFLLVFQGVLGQKNTSETFDIYSKDKKVSILYDKNGSSLDSISAHLLAKDVFRITSQRPLVTTNKDEPKGNLIVIGKLTSELISEYIETENLPEDFLKQKESYHLKVISKSNSTKKTLIIAGTDARGTAYGVFDISEKLGISPWYWWADAPTDKKDRLAINQTDFFSKEPSVEYRGIFLNDEDWGLQPWAAHTFEPEVGDIGPKTYSKIFELLLRLKANTIWPAMHPSTKAFFHYSKNPEIAKKFQIVIGTSHAEPMLRNNVDEWNKETMGAFNYLSNKEKVNDYWETRVKGATTLDAIYTLGMRGIHDSGMEGVSGIEEATMNLQKVINEQRNLLKKHNNKDLSDIPQVFTVYKEVLDIYDYGLDLPEDITIMWTDDNYGYIRRLGDKNERARKGGGGVYYHASYWGRPHDYQWISSTHPGLIREEMMKAYQTNNKKMWILNVGDLKPAEYNMQLFLDMAYNAENFQKPETVEEHMNKFYTSIFGKKVGKSISELKLQYYDLAFERKPEFMGWSQTEPTTEIDTTAYNPFSWGDEVNKRIEKYDELEKQVVELKKQIGSSAQDAYFQLVYYPVKGASFMNKKFLYRDLALKYSKQSRIIAETHKNRSHAYFDSISSITKKYNTEIANGKWNKMMDMAPRELPVFHKPEISIPQNETSSGRFGISVENSQNNKDLALPRFYENSARTHFIDVYLKQTVDVNWSLNEIPEYVIPSTTEGKLDNEILQHRISVKIDWEKWKSLGEPESSKLTLNLGEKTYPIKIKTKPYFSSKSNKNVFVEQNGLVIIYAENYSEKKDYKAFEWEKISGLGYTGNLMQATPFTKKPIDTLNLSNSPSLHYEIITESSSKTGELVLNTLPTHPLTKNHSVRVGVQWNENPIEIIDFRTFGRSEEWKQNVLRNLAKVSLPVKIEKSGKQTLKIYMVDQGVALDFISINFKDQNLPYSLLPETKIKN